MWDENVKTREASAKRKEEAARRIEIEHEQRVRDEINKSVDSLAKTRQLVCKTR